MSFVSQRRVLEEGEPWYKLHILVQSLTQKSSTILKIDIVCFREFIASVMSILHVTEVLLQNLHTFHFHFFTFVSL